MENNLIEKYKAQALLPTLEEVIADLDFSANYSHPKLCAFLVESKVCSAREFNRARQIAYVKTVLGTFPQNAAELIDAIVESYGVASSEVYLTGLRWTLPIRLTHTPTTCSVRSLPVLCSKRTKVAAYA